MTTSVGSGRSDTNWGLNTMDHFWAKLQTTEISLKIPIFIIDNDEDRFYFRAFLFFSIKRDTKMGMYYFLRAHFVGSFLFFFRLHYAGYIVGLIQIHGRSWRMHNACDLPIMLMRCWICDEGNPKQDPCV